MLDETSTLDDTPRVDGEHRLQDDLPLPGLILIFSGGRPRLGLISLLGQGRELGRDTADLVADRRISRRHVRVRYVDGMFDFHDLGSQNGTLVDGRLCTGAGAKAAGGILRLGDSLLLLSHDLRPYLQHSIKESQDRVVGPQLAAVYKAIENLACVSQTLHIHGESGSGKEWAARAFLTSGPHPSGPFVAVNCATIPDGVAERLLFGSVRGAYSGADSDSRGYLEAAHGGVLFLDEIGEISIAVQAKLLRVLESREVLPLGATRPRLVDVRLCSATHRSLRELVATDRLRADLYFRIATPAVHLPALRERPADIPFLIAQEVARCAPGMQLHTSLVEMCLLRPWPGNVRELLGAIRAAVPMARADGKDRLDSSYLSPMAGLPLSVGSGDSSPAPDAPRPVSAEDPTVRIRTAVLAEALRNSNGNVSAAAAALGMHRTQLRRWLTRYGITPRSQ